MTKLDIAYIKRGTLKPANLDDTFDYLKGQPIFAKLNYHEQAWLALALYNKHITEQDVKVLTTEQVERRCAQANFGGDLIGLVLWQCFLRPNNITVQMLADRINVHHQTVYQILSGGRGISPSMSLRLGRFFGNNPKFWMGLQNLVELSMTNILEYNEIEAITPLFEKADVT